MAFQRAVLGYFAAVSLHRGHQGIVHCPFKLVGIEGVTGLFQKPCAELHPGECHAGFHHMV